MGGKSKSASQGLTLHVNRQGGHDLKKITTPKKYLRSAKNTGCDEIGLTQSAACNSYTLTNTYIWHFEQDLLQSWYNWYRSTLKILELLQKYLEYCGSLEGYFESE